MRPSDSIAIALRFEAPIFAQENLLTALLLEEGHCLRDQALDYCAKGRWNVASSLSATSLPTVMQMVASGYGATLLPEVAVDAELRDDRVKLLRFVEPQPGRSIGLAWRRTSPRKVDFLALGQMVKNALNAPARSQCIRHERAGLRREI